MSVEIYRDYLAIQDKTQSYLGGGVDSEVHRIESAGGEYVVKVYNRNRSTGCLSPETAVLYSYVTNEAHLFAKRVGLSCKFLNKKVGVFINPVTNIIFDDSEQICVNISPFVDGVRLSRCVEDYCFSSGVPWFSFDMAVDVRDNAYKIGTYTGLADLQKKLIKELGVSGIDLMAMNIKIVEDGLCITDLCAAINRISVSEPDKLAKMAAKNSGRK